MNPFQQYNQQPEEKESKADFKHVRMLITEYDQKPSKYPLAHYTGKTINHFSVVVEVQPQWVELSTSIYCNWFVNQLAVGDYISRNRAMYGITAPHFSIRAI